MCSRRRKLFVFGAVLVLILSTYWSYTLVSLRFVKKHMNGSRSSLNVLAEPKESLPLIANGRGEEIESTFIPRTNEVERTTHTALFHYLSKLEHMVYMSSERPKAIIKSTTQSAQNNIVLYKKSLEDIGTDVYSIPDKGALGDYSGWSAFLCFLPENNISCLTKDAFALLKGYQKVNHIPGLDKVLLRNDGFCYTMTASRQISSLAPEPLSPPCHVLPAQHKHLTDDSKTKNTSWIVKPVGSVVTSKDDWGITVTFEDVRNLGGTHVIHALPSDPLILAGRTAVIQVYVLVMSVVPLRLYKHQEGVTFVYSIRKAKGEIWTLQILNEHLVDRFDDKTAKRALRNLDTVIVKTLLTVESSMISNFESLGPMYRCQHCFQLLVFSCMFNSSLHPFVLEVKDSMQSDIPENIVRDTVHILLKQNSASKSVFHALNTFNDTIGIKKFGCGSSHKACLLDADLKYLIRQHNEDQHLGAFTKIYPTPDGERYSKLLIELKSSGGGVTVGHIGHTHHGDTTSELHNVLTTLERYNSFKRREAESLQAINTEMFWAGTSLEDKSSNTGRAGVETDQPKCNDDADMALIELHIEPAGELSPVFSSTTYSYQATMPFETMVIKIWGRTSTCEAEVRINSLRAPSEPSNFSVGVGWNHFQVLVVDVSRTPVHVEEVYKVSIFRQRRSEDEKPFVENVPHQVCSQVQDCDLKVYASKPCGLELIQQNSWKAFLEGRAKLRTCENGHEDGRWVLPCESCVNSHSCHWREAVWAPFSCQYHFLTRDELQACMVKKKVLFVGDSTNRGMMYYLMEKLNGSLKTWEKTHSMKVYSNQLSSSGTSVSYAYYPQYWLPRNQKPGFVKALYQLIARFLPLENNNKTVLSVGGVQWLAAGHIRDMKIALKSLGLDNIKVVVKTSGSGFHMPLPGMKHNNLAAQQMEATRNDHLINTVKAFGYDAVDTFGITVSRYKEFLSGKCGCHFHKVIDRKSNFKEEDEAPSHSWDGSLSRYHVIGPINSVYSEILIGRLCS